MSSHSEHYQRVRFLAGLTDSINQALHAMMGHSDLKPVKVNKRVRELIEMQYRITRDTVVVVPVLISKGRVSRETFMKDLEGFPVTYSGEPLLPHTGLARWVEQRVAESRKTRATSESRQAFPARYSKSSARFSAGGECVSDPTEM